MSEQEARTEVVRTYHALARLGMNTASAGNVSVRFRPGMIITRTATTAETVSEENLVAVALDPRPSSDDGFESPPLAGAHWKSGPPSSEWQMHAAIYAARPDGGCIIHTHADACTALASLGEKLPAFHYMVAAFGGGDVRCAPYVTFGTRALAEAAAAAIKGRRACLLANHGMVVHGRDAAHALELAVLLETLCRQYLLARCAGTPRLLTKSELEAARARFVDYAAGRG